ncbi:MAG: tRNA lysidine(34) synthetase TilS [Bacilli bacterium]
MNLNLDHNKKYLLGCSFGPDSMALLHMLKEEGYNFSVAHVNYQLRKEANDEMQSLIAYCQENNIPIFVTEINYDIQTNIEARCREIRYKYFASLCQQNNFDYVVVGHHQDDLLETFLLQKRRKNLVNYYGIKKKSYIFGVCVLRPLLEYTKADLLIYCQKNNIPFAIDSSNLTDQYERNKIRHNKVEMMNKTDRQKLLADINRENQELVEMYLQFQKNDIHSCQYLRELNIKFFAYALHVSARQIKEDAHISLSCVKEIRNALYSDKPNIIMKVNSSLFFVKSYDRCNFTSENQDINYLFTLDKPDFLDNEYFYLDFRSLSSNRNINIDDYPLTIRNARHGDITKIKNYCVSVRRLFIDWKMPIELRKRWPVIINKDGLIVYVPRYQKNFVKSKNINFYVK